MGKSQLFFGEVVPREDVLMITKVTSWAAEVEQHRNPKQTCASEVQGNVLKPDTATIASFGRFAHKSQPREASCFCRISFSALFIEPCMG